MPRTFAKSLFFGEVAYDVAFPFPEMGRDERERVEGLLDEVRAKGLHARMNAVQASNVPEIPADVFHDCAQLGIFKHAIPEAFGGTPLSHLARARVFEALGHEDLALAIAVSTAASAGPLALVHFAQPALQSMWLPQIATGEVTTAFALAESGAGSDAAGIHTRADLDEQGNYVVTGEKAWVTNGGFAQGFVVFARTSPTDEDAKPKLTALWAPRDATITHIETSATLGLETIGCPRIRFAGTRVPPAAVLGEPGRGFRVAVDLFNRTRIMLAASTLGAVKRTLRHVLARCDDRRAFGRNIGEFALIKDRVADLMVDTFALESLIYWTSGLADAEDADVSIESALCKIVAAEIAQSTANHAFEIFASAAYLKASPIARFVRDARALSILQGTNDVLGCFVALSGMQGPGREIEEVAKAIREPIKGFGLLSELAIRHAKTAFGRGSIASPVHPALARETAILEAYTGDLSRNVDKVLRRHGSNIAEMQFTQRRVANMTQDLVVLVACLARTTKAIGKRGEEGSRREIDLLRIFAERAERRLKESAGVDENDDELRKGVASRAYMDGAYPLEL